MSSPSKAHGSESPQQSLVGLESLGHDILVNYVFPYLSESDIRELSSVSSTLKNYADDPAVWHDLFYRTFGHQPNPFTIYNWPEMYRWRSKAGLYTWGESANGRLGYVPLESQPHLPITHSSYIPVEFRVPNRFGIGICSPFPVSSLTDIAISDLVSGGFWSAILTANGEIYGIGELYDPAHYPRLLQTPNYSDYGDHADVQLLAHNQQLLEERRVANITNRTNLTNTTDGVNNRPTSRISRFLSNIRRGPVIHPNNNIHGNDTTDASSVVNETETEEDENLGINYSTSTSDRAKLKRLSVLTNQEVRFMELGGNGRTHLLALDSNNDVWVWDIAFCAPGSKLSLDFNEGQAKPRRILKLQASWNCNAALVEGVGLVVWYLDNAQKIPSTRKQEREWKDAGTSVSVETVLIPHTDAKKGSNDYVIDFHAGDKFLVYITNEGKLYRVNTDNRDQIQNHGRKELKEFSTLLETLAKQNTKKDVYTEPPKFVKITGGYRLIAAISDTDNVVYSDAVQDSEAETTRPQAPPELQNVGCISVVAGDHHYLALLKGGKLLSWGTESQRNGCLGLRTSVYQSRSFRGDLSISSPTPVQTPGKVLAISAGGWQSSAIITTDDIDEA